jgi:hypothetical protein
MPGSLGDNSTGYASVTVNTRCLNWSMTTKYFKLRDHAIFDWIVSRKPRIICLVFSIISSTLGYLQKLKYMECNGRSTLSLKCGQNVIVTILQHTQTNLAPDDPIGRNLNHSTWYMAAQFCCTNRMIVYRV